MLFHECELLTELRKQFLNFSKLLLYWLIDSRHIKMSFSRCIKTQNLLYLFQLLVQRITMAAVISVRCKMINLSVNVLERVNLDQMRKHVLVCIPHVTDVCVNKLVCIKHVY